MTKIDALVGAFVGLLSDQTQTYKLALVLDSQLPLLAAEIPMDQMLTVILDGGSAEASRFAQSVRSWQKVLNANRNWHVIAGEMTEQERAGDVVSDLSQTIHYLLAGGADTGFVVTAAALQAPVPDPVAYHEQVRAITVGERVAQHEVLTSLVTNGYTRYETTLEPGGVLVRGEQITLQHPMHDYTTTLTWLGGVIEAITTQRGTRSKSVRNAALLPVRFPDASVPLASLLATHVVCRPLHATAVGHPTIIYDALESDAPWPLPPVQLSQLPEHALHVWYINRDRVETYLADHGLTGSLCSADLASSPFAFALDDDIVVSEAMLIPETVKTIRPLTRAKGLELLAQLVVGHPAVHSDHGIGIYEGLQTRTLATDAREYLLLRYAAGDTLSVPVEYAHKVTPYIGEESPPIHRLGGAGWTKVRAQARADAEAFAKELLTTAGQRTASQGHTYELDQKLDDKLDATFPFTLTADQERAWSDVRDDLAGDAVMDRLIVGDVGFGKTELALRAARHVVANGKQVAVLAPTTLLVQQHTDTWRRRFPELASNISTLSRFSTAKELTQTRAAIASGETDIAIGTHALLSDRTKWKNLGLIIIDEEQRFGVKQKEHFKSIRAAVDMLSLSATPIPRTLSMSLSGIKQLSVISTAPEGRQHVTTQVGRDSDDVLESALTHELARSGQIYVVAPKIRQLPNLKLRIEEILPHAKVAIAHGQLPPKQLAAIMQQFDTGELDILISSTIIESGIDLPNANTIVVTHATHFGLADLYQLRGRVGRRQRQGHAYFLYDQTELTSVQRQRLAALTEATRLGSGWALAQRDLEIRGAGNLLGAAQSGTINAVGAQLYLDLVREAVDQQQTPIRRHDVDIQLPLIATLPEHYVAAPEERTTLYQQLARAGSAQDVDLLAEAIAGRYGPLPLVAETLVVLIKLQHAAAKAGVNRIHSATVTPSDEDPYQRLIIEASKLPSLLGPLTTLGNWEVKDDTLQLGVDAIDLTLVKKLLAVLE